MKATYRVDEKSLDQMPMALTVTMRRCDWQQVQQDLERALQEKWNLHTSRFFDLVRGMIRAHHHATSGEYHLDESGAKHVSDKPA